MIMKLGQNGHPTLISRIIGKTKLISGISKNNQEVRSKWLSDAYFSSYRPNKIYASNFKK